MSLPNRERTYRTEAIILDRFDLGETDRILTLFSRDFGKLRAIAKGVRRPTSKLAPALEYFTRCRLILSRGRELDVITSAEVIERPNDLGVRMSAFSYASHIAEVTNRLTGDAQELPAVYDLLAVALDQIDRGNNPWTVARWFELAVLALTGYRLDLFHCVQCNRDLEQETNYLGNRAGGILCPACRSIDPNGRAVTINAQKFLRTLDRGGYQGASRLRLDASLEFEIETTLTIYMRGVAERDLTSLRVLREIRETAPQLDF